MIFRKRWPTQHAILALLILCLPTKQWHIQCQVHNALSNLKEQVFVIPSLWPQENMRRIFLRFEMQSPRRFLHFHPCLRFSRRGRSHVRLQKYIRKLCPWPSWLVCTWTKHPVLLIKQLRVPPFCWLSHHKVDGSSIWWFIDFAGLPCRSKQKNHEGSQLQLKEHCLPKEGRLAGICRNHSFQDKVNIVKSITPIFHLVQAV